MKNPEKISNLVDPMELANYLSDVRKEVKGDEYLQGILDAGISLTEDIMAMIGASPEANRGAVVLASVVMSIIQGLGDNEEYEHASEEEYKDYVCSMLFIGFRSLMVSILSHENIIAAKTALEGGFELYEDLD